MATTSFIKYRSGGTKTAWTTAQAAGVMSNDDIDTNFATLNLNKLEAGDPTLSTVTANGSSTNTSLSLLGNNTLGNTTSSVTTVKGMIKGGADINFSIYGGDINGTNSYDTLISAGNRINPSAYGDGAGDLFIKGGDCTGGDGYNSGGDLYLYGGDVSGYRLPGSATGGGGEIHIVSGTNLNTATADKSSGNVYIDVAGVGANGTRTFGQIYIGAAMAYRSGVSVYDSTTVNIGTSYGLLDVKSPALFESRVSINTGGSIQFRDELSSPGASTVHVFQYYYGDLVLAHYPFGGGTVTYPFTFGADNSFYCNNNITANNNIRAGADIIAYYTSDQTLKTNIVKIDSALSKVNSLDGVTFNWNEKAVEKFEKDVTVREAGVIAQQVQAVLPEVVKTREDGTLAVRYEQMVPLLIEAIKELTSQVKDLQNQLNNK